MYRDTMIFVGHFSTRKCSKGKFGQSRLKKPLSYSTIPFSEMADYPLHIKKAKVPYLHRSSIEGSMQSINAPEKRQARKKEDASPRLLWWSPFGLRFLSCEIDNVTYLKLRKNDCHMTHWQIYNYFPSKQTWVKKVVILSESNCHFVNSLNFSNRHFFFSA